MQMTKSTFKVPAFRATIFAEEGETIPDIKITAHHGLNLTDSAGNNAVAVAIDVNVPVVKGD